jgi:hypothetical protein
MVCPVFLLLPLALSPTLPRYIGIAIGAVVLVLAVAFVVGLVKRRTGDAFSVV